MAYLTCYSIPEKKNLPNISLDPNKINEFQGFTLSYEFGGWILTAQSNLIFCGYPVISGETKLLSPEYTIWIPQGNVYYFRRDDEKEKGKKEKKITTAELERQYQEFWKKGKYNQDLALLVSRLFSFTRRRYKYSCAIFYFVQDMKAKYYKAKCRNLKEYKTPETILKRVYLTEKPFSYSPERDLTPSLSMMENSVAHIFCYPFKNSDQEITAIFYADSTGEIEEEVNEYLNFICSCINNPLAQHVEKFLFAPKEVNLR